MSDRGADATAGPDALDFWVGDWTCSWEGGRGTNRISKELGGRVVVERFEALAPELWSGLSVSVHDGRRGWRQTWVDSTGNYWTFDGAPHPEGFSFSTTEDEDGRRVDKRMVFSGIADERFAWRWERSFDRGRTWEVLWTIRYDRAGKEPSGTARNRNGSARTR
jgi:hypothetical protein